MIRVLVVDDHGVVRAGLDQLLSATPGVEVVGRATDGLDAVPRLEISVASSKLSFGGSTSR